MYRNPPAVRDKLRMIYFYQFCIIVNIDVRSNKATDRSKTDCAVIINKNINNLKNIFSVNTYENRFNF